MPINDFNIIADYEFWVKFDEWNVEQMTALLIGYNPLYLNHNLIYNLSEGLIDTLMTEDEIETLCNKYQRTHALILASIEAGTIKSRISPVQCYKWTQSKNIPIFTEFHTAINDIKPEFHKMNSDKTYNPKRNKQLYKIILSLAIKYKFDPRQNKNPSTARIKDAIQRIGLNIDDNTIREIVKTSYEIYKDDIDGSIFQN